MESSESQPHGVAIDPIDCLRRGWALIGDQYGLLVAMGLLFMLMVNAQTALIPMPILAGPLMCGLYVALRTRSEGGRARLDQLFEGFRRFWPAFLASLLHLLIFALTAIPFAIVLVLAGLSAGAAFNSGAVVLGVCIATFTVLTALALAIALLVANTLIWFTYPLIVERDLSAAAAIAVSAQGARRHIGGLVVLHVVLAVLTTLAYLALIVPGLLVFPVILAASWVAYREVFPIQESCGQPSVPDGVAPVGEPSG